MLTNKELADHIFVTTNPSDERDQIINALYATDALDRGRDAVAALATLAEARDEIVALVRLADNISYYVSELSDLLCSDRLRHAVDVINDLDAEALTTLAKE